MLNALDQNENLVSLLENIPTKREGKYYCPACHELVYLKNGAIKIPHFAHKSLKNCDSWSENESAQHLGLKMQLYQWFSQDEKVEVERFLPLLNQTPDLLVNDKIAIEIQCSSLSLKRLKERTENYHKHGYTVIWLMGEDLWLKKTLSVLQKNLMYFSQNRGFYFWELDFERKKLRLKSLIHQDLRGKMVHLTEEFSFGCEPLLNLLRSPFHGQKLRSLEVKEDKMLLHFVQQQLFHHSPKWLKIQEKYYQKGRNLLEQNFNRIYMAPPGLSLLEEAFEEEQETFMQVPQDTQAYYQAFLSAFQEGKMTKLYPPRYYEKRTEGTKKAPTSKLK